MKIRYSYRKSNLSGLLSPQTLNQLRILLDQSDTSGLNQSIHSSGPGIQEAVSDSQETYNSASDHKRDAHARILREAYSEIVTGNAVTEGKVEQAFRQICRTVARTLSLDRCSIWLLSENGKLVCQQLYLMGQDQFAEGGIYDSAAIPQYLGYLRAEMVLETADAANDPRLEELKDSYIDGLNIGAMLDSAISLDGELLGVICCESIGRCRNWLGEEIFFMRALADQAALTMSNRVRLEAIEKIRRNDLFFHDLFEDSPLGITIRDQDDRLLVFNRAWRQIWKLDDDYIAQLMGRGAGQVESKWPSFADYRQEDVARIREIQRNGGSYVIPELRTLNRPEGAAKWVSQQVYISKDGDGGTWRQIGITEDITERKQAQQMLEQLASSLNAATGREFFRILTQRLCQSLGVSHSLICQISKDDRGMVETISVCQDGTQLENISYALEGTPCASVIGGRPCHIENGVQRQFPHDELLRQMGVDSYMGIPLNSSQGQPLGLMAILGREAIASPDVARNFLEVFSNRAAAELERLQAEQELSASEERFRIAMTIMNEGMVMLDAEGRISYVNQVLASLIGLPRNRLEGRPAEDIVAHESQDIYAEQRERRRSGGAGNYEGMLLCANGDSIPVRVNATPLFSGDGDFLGSIAIVTDLRSKRREEQAVREHREEMRRITAELALSEERERRRLASSLHDGIGHSLSSLAILLQELSSSLPDGGGAKLEQGLRITREAIDSSRGIVFELSPPMLHEMGLLPTLRWLAEHTHKTYGIPVSVIDNEVAAPLQEEIRILLFQAVRELLFNAVKHSKASHVVITVDGHENGVRLGVSDDGVGFDFNELLTMRSQTGSYGLYSINERMNHVGGQLEINARPGQGASFFLNAPLRAANRQQVEVAKPAPQGQTAGTGTTRVLLVDDQQLIRQGVRSILSRDPGIEVVGEAENGRHALEQARRLRPDIVLMDIDMPEMDGIAATAEIRRTMPETRVVALSMHEDIQVVGEMLQAGARGYLLKNHVEHDLVNAIHSVSDNISFLSAQVAERVVNDYIAEAAGRQQLSLNVLTERELEILRMVMRGEASKSIAIQLDISIRTVETHRRNIMKKLGVNSLPELIRLAIQEGIEI